jgi:hypothetical protein
LVTFQPALEWDADERRWTRKDLIKTSIPEGSLDVSGEPFVYTVSEMITNQKIEGFKEFGLQPPWMTLECSPETEIFTRVFTA